MKRLAVAILACASAMAALRSTCALAMPIPITDAPLDRVIANLESKLRDNPDDADVHYQLGRAHALAYSTKRSSIRGFEGAGGFNPLPPDCRDYDPHPDQAKGEALADEQLIGHLKKSVEQLVKAIRL